MAAAESTELKVREKQEVASPAEQTTPGPVFTPAVDIFETEKESIQRVNIKCCVLTYK